ncbi:uncharacterized protein LOC114302068 isoform X5 [Camellia sinensis]|uniref:uncharacterized protein LOC114302068 isoform X5 n=1 Tax=Camellia sinensis TaxID=4442 RepID=UPI0010355412|nr:uncharacterized protein LOC114302068 isoform X5 [Camellia sinensis]
MWKLLAALFKHLYQEIGERHKKRRGWKNPIDLGLKLLFQMLVLLQAIILLQLVPVVMIAPSVQKRHIYDIINDLEGIGLIEKKLKNRNRWKYRWELMCQGQGRLIRMLLSYRCLSH